MNEIEKEIWDFIQRMNRLWTMENRPEELKNYFHKNMIAITPVDKLRREGKEECVKGWVEFAKAAKTHYWKETDPKIYIYNNGYSAIVTFYYDMEYEINGKITKSGGRDLYFLIKEDSRWWVVADEFSEFPK